ncbi:MAG: helix-turn-helix domain-containing protein [Sporocytophaga sp.]|nr:helix-turn-helix domain-containing protein [Sporocytophaga sp.]
MLPLGVKIRKLRELKGFKQENMAELLGVSQSSYSKMESDEMEISKERLEQISKILGLSVQDIMSFDEHMFFNQMNSHSSGYNNNQHGTGYTINQYGMHDNERKLYEEKIKMLEEKNRLLEELNELQKKEIDQFKSRL